MGSPSTPSSPRKLWEHPDPKNTNMAKFMRLVNNKRGMQMNDFYDLYEWSVGDHREEFWADVWDYLGIIHEGRYSTVVEPHTRMDSVPKWFSGVRLNFAENILYSRPTAYHPSDSSITGKEDDKIAVTQVREGGSHVLHVSWGELRRRVGRLASAMRASGVQKGDRVAAVASNSVDTLAVFLAVTSLGGLFSSSSTDMGVRGVLDRLIQIKPKWVFMDDAAFYNGKETDLRDKMAEVVNGMSNTQELQGLVSLPRWEKALDVKKVPRAMTLAEYLQKATTDRLEFVRVEFADPFLIVYSSGTTGQPKCIVHSVGGVVLSSQKESILYRDMGPRNVCLQFTTTSWIMYLSSMLCLQYGARLVCYDGSPFHPDPKAFIKIWGEQKVTNLGLSPRYFQTLASANINPREVTDLSNLEHCTCTGMVLPPALFRWFYDTGFPGKAHLANIAGGTDIAGTFACENPLLPLYDVGGCQGPSLGTPIAIYDSTVPTPDGNNPPKGREVDINARGEDSAGDLVATKAFPNMPVFFWPPESQQAQKKYYEAYFARFDNVWTHGDYLQKDPDTGAYVFLGRADGVLNPSGIRFGSAEIYTVIESHFAEEVEESLCVGQRRANDTDESVFLFVKMQPSKKFTDDLVAQIKSKIGRECSKRHIPKYVFETPEIPTTVNGKKVELPVKHVVSGRTVKASDTLLNPKSLDFYYQFAKIEELLGGQGKPKAKL